jgi:hypothetical protein
MSTAPRISSWDVHPPKAISGWWISSKELLRSTKKSKKKTLSLDNFLELFEKKLRGRSRVSVRDPYWVIRAGDQLEETSKSS